MPLVGNVYTAPDGRVWDLVAGIRTDPDGIVYPELEWTEEERARAASWRLVAAERAARVALRDSIVALRAIRVAAADDIAGHTARVGMAPAAFMADMLAWRVRVDRGVDTIAESLIGLARVVGKTMGDM